MVVADMNALLLLLCLLYCTIPVLTVPVPGTNENWMRWDTFGAILACGTNSPLSLSMMPSSVGDGIALPRLPRFVSNASTCKFY